IAIIGILVGLSIPAVMSAIERGRWLQCQNNLKQLGLAVIHYESDKQQFPAGSTWRKIADTDVVQTPKLGPNWIIRILPMLDELPLADTFDLNQDITSDVTILGGQNNKTARGIVMATVMCPSDAYNRTPYHGSQFGLGDGWARGNYAANGSLAYLSA